MESSNKKALFIKTTDKETSELLVKNKFELLDYSNGVWTFINNFKSKVKFDKNKIIQSNNLFI